MITQQHVNRLLQFKNGSYLVTSCYLNLDRSKMPLQMLKIRTKDLIQAAKKELMGKTATHDQRESLREDLEKIELFVIEHAPANQHKGLALFSCAGEKFWQAFPLPRLNRNILIADHVPYIRPLSAILSEYHRYCTVLVDRTHGKLFEVYMGEIVEHTGRIDPVPRRVREGGLGGREERGIERHHDQAVHQHYQKLADSVFESFQREKFDWLVLGGQRDVLREFKNHLHPYLRERWVDDFHSHTAQMTAPEVLAQSLEIEHNVEWKLEQRMADELVQKSQTHDRAVSGVTSTLAALGRGEAQMLLVEDGFETPGYVCHDCRHVSLEDAACPRCHQPTQACPDVVDEAIELALQKSCQIEHVHSATQLHEAGRMGAFLRYQTRDISAPTAVLA